MFHTDTITTMLELFSLSGRETIQIDYNQLGKIYYNIQTKT